MPKQFHIATKNSSRWVDQTISRDARYNNLPFEQQRDEYDYYQPRQTNDIEPIQVLSDWIPTLKYYTCDGVFVREVDLLEVPVSIVGYTFKCYEASVDWSDFDTNALYYGEITYTDDDENVHTLACTPIDLRVNHPLSRLFEYRNSDNQDEDGVIWETGIVMNIRVDALVEKFQPKSDRSDYNDQDFDGELLFGTAFRWWTLKLLDAFKIGLPNWIIDKMNRIFTECDDVLIDGTNYIAVSGQEFKLSRPDAGENQDAYVEIDIQEVPNPNFGQLETGDNPTDDDYVIMPKPLQFTNKGAPFSFAGTFKVNTKLTGIAIYNNGLTEFVMQLGTTLGGSEIAQDITISADPSTHLLVEHLFATASTLYITVPNGVNISGWVEWLKYDMPAINPNPVQPTPYNAGDIHFYADLANYDSQFDNAGVGILGSAHEGCVVCGTNGVYEALDWGDATLIHNLLNMGTMSNNGTITIAKTNLPAAGVLIASSGDDPVAAPGNAPSPTKVMNIGRSNTTGGKAYYISATGTTANTLTSGNMGDGTPLANIPKGLNGVFFTYVG